MPDFLAAHPHLSVELIVRDQLGDLVAEGVDLALRFGEPEPSTLIARKLLETRIVTCASPAYLARMGAPTHPLDLERHECLMFRDPSAGRPFEWEFRRGDEVVAVNAAGRLTMNDLATKLAACVAGLGVAQSLALGIDGLLNAGVLVQVLPDWAEESFPLYVYYPARQQQPAKVRAFLDFIEREPLTARTPYGFGAGPAG
jgi:DNA-binding transcriptional LysR family regulator